MAETSRVEVRESMTLDETEADVIAIQAQFEAIPTQVEGSKSPISIGSPSRPSTPREVESPRSGTADSLTASGSKKKESNTSRVGLLFKKYLGGDKEKDKRKKEESEPSSPKPSGDIETTSEDSITSSGRDNMADGAADDSISAPPASTPLGRSDRRRAQSRSWGENALTRSPSASVGASQSPNHRGSSTMVTVTIDSPGSPSSSAPGSNRSSTQSSRPTSGANTSPPPSLKTSGGGSRPTSGASSPHETSPINSSGSDKSPPLRRVNNSSGVFTRNKSGDNLNSSTPVLIHSSSTSSIPMPVNTEAAPKSETAFSGASRLRRRAAVFQKSSERFGDTGFVHGTVDEQSALEEAVNIWDEPKDEHIVYEKKVEPEPEKASSSTATAGSPATASPVAAPSARSTVMLTQDDTSSTPLGAATAGVSELSLISHERQGTLGTGATAVSSGVTEEVASGTLNQLVKHLTSSKGVDGRALQTFLLTYTSFTSPKVLLEKLIQRYNIPKHKMEPKAGEERSQAEARARQKQLRVVNFLRKWIELCFVDFTEEIIEMVFQFCEQLRTNGSTPLATLIDNALASKLAGLAKRKNTQFKQPPPASIMPKKPAAAGGYAAYELLDVDPVELARQLTLIDYDLFGQIRPAELLNQSWNKPKLKHRSPHVLEMIQRFNTLSKWLCSQILKCESIKERTKVMQHVIHLGRNLLELNNFNSFNAILSAMQNSAVHRLSHTKEACGSKFTKLLDAWTTLMSPRQNSANYKAALAAAAAPAIPYLGLYLSQLTFIEEGNPPRLHGLINFKKCRLISKVIVNLLQYQVGKRYNFVPLDSIRDMLSTLTASETDDELYELSLKREPRMPQPS